MDQTETNQLKEILNKYDSILRIFLNWVLTINAGGIVAVLSYIATGNNSVGVIIPTLGAFSVGLLSGLLWIFANYVAVALLTYRILNEEEKNNININININAHIKLSCIFGFIATACMIWGMSHGFFSLLGYCSCKTFILSTIILLIVLSIASLPYFFLTKK